MNKYQLPVKVEKVIRTNKRLWRHGGKFITWALAFFLIGIFSKSMWDGYWRTYQWSWRTPVIFQNPLSIKKLKSQAQKVESIVKPKQAPLKPKKTSYLPIVVKTEKDIVLAQKHGEVLWNIYMLESTRGKNDYCRANGLGFAGFGVMNEGKIICYESFEKAAQRASYWYGKLSEGNDLATSLCIWNQGIATNDCNYFLTYKTL